MRTRAITTAPPISIVRTKGSEKYKLKHKKLHTLRKEAQKYYTHYIKLNETIKI